MLTAALDATRRERTMIAKRAMFLNNVDKFNGESKLVSLNKSLVPAVV